MLQIGRNGRVELGDVVDAFYKLAVGDDVGCGESAHVVVKQYLRACRRGIVDGNPREVACRLLPLELVVVNGYLIYLKTLVVTLFIYLCKVEVEGW